MRAAALPARAVRGTTLLEIMLVLVVLGLLATSAAPRFGRAMEQVRVDQACAALRSVWTAQRLWWMEEGVYCGSLEDLAALRLLDGALLAQDAPFTLGLEGAGAEGFTARMSRSGSDTWSGAIEIDAGGLLAGFTQDGEGAHVEP